MILEYHSVMATRIAIRKSGTLLAVISATGLLWTVGICLYELVSHDFLLVLKTADGLGRLDWNDVTFAQRLVINCLLLSPNLAWIWGLLEMLRLGVLCRAGEALTARAARRFEGFGYSLMAMAMLQVAVLPLVVAYLRWQKLMNPTMGFWDGFLGSDFIPTIAAAILVAVTARIIRLSATIAEESALTV
jgi:hypothetical protein